MVSPAKGSVVLVAFPFSDLSASKLRFIMQADIMESQKLEVETIMAKSESRLRPKGYGGQAGGQAVPAPSAFAAFKQWASRSERDKLGACPASRGVRCSSVAPNLQEILAMADKSAFASLPGADPLSARGRSARGRKAERVRPQPTAHSLQPSSSSGIALIMTLGVLSVMLIMAVAFSVSMRTERLAAGNYADSVRARQLVQVGLARALNDLANQLGANGLMSALGGTNYPTWIVTNSYTNQNVFSFGGTVITNQATNFVPRALWSAAMNADQSGAANHWLAIDSLVYTNYVTNTYLASSNRLGAVKYLILNCSGLLDANFAGSDGSTRGVGTNSSELAIHTMPEFDNNDATDFLNQRDSGASRDYRYETLEEFTVLNQANFSLYPSNFTVYSHAPAGYWDSGAVLAQNQVNLAGDATDLAGRKDLIIAAFDQAGFTLAEAGILYTNLIDYVDSDSIPSVSTIGSVERVPMISKITVTTSAGLPPYDVTVTFTLWNPFVTGGVASCDFNASVDIVTVGTMPAFSQSGITLTNGQTRDIQSMLGGVPASSYQLQINSAGTTNASGQLDQLKPGVVLGRSFQVPFADPQHWECKDPRFNFDPDSADWDAYDGSDPSPPYRVTRDYWTANPSVDQDAAMYVANQPLQSVGELGYLPYGLWRTVKLYGPNLHRVLDAFAIGTNSTDVYVTDTRRGRVNPHTRETEVLSAVFSNMPVDEYPGQAASRLTGDQLWKVVTNIQANALIFDTNNALIFSYTNLSAFGRNFTAFPAAADNELKREAIFRNTAGLFSVRQNLFTIIIEAMVGSGGISRNSIRQRAVALVWRDPYTGEMFVRSIKWLRD